MKSSSFLCGVVLGASAAYLTFKKKSGSTLLSMMSSGANTAMKYASQSDQKMGGSHCSSKQGTTSKGPESSAQEYPSRMSSADKEDTKERRVNVIRDFIRNNEEVRKEVDSILKETNTVIPGL